MGPVTGPTIAAAMCDGYPDLEGDWRLVAAALAALGVAATTAVWSDAAVDWAMYDVVVIRGTWDYVDRLEEFRAWARRVEAATRLVNSAATVRWNTDKRYLGDLAADGVPVVATEWVPPGHPWHPPVGEFVVKPAVSAGGFETARYHAGDADRAAADGHVRRLHHDGRLVMVQPYVAAVDEEGETALIYLGGRFSHAVNKAPMLRAGAGVEPALWSRHRIVAAEATAAQLQVGDDTLAAVTARTGPATYARVDLFPGLVVSEVELIEPALFLEYGPNAAARFAEVLAALLGPAGPGGHQQGTQPAAPAR